MFFTIYGRMFPREAIVGKNHQLFAHASPETKNKYTGTMQVSSETKNIYILYNVNNSYTRIKTITKFTNFLHYLLTRFRSFDNLNVITYKGDS